MKLSLGNTANRETSPDMERFDIVIPGRQRPDVNGNTLAPSKVEAKVPSPTSTNYLNSEPLFKKTIAAFTTCLSTTACTGDKLDPPKLADEVPLLLNSFFLFFFFFFFLSFFLLLFILFLGEKNVEQVVLSGVLLCGAGVEQWVHRLRRALPLYQGYFDDKIMFALAVLANLCQLSNCL